jgi:hypothetical protein
LIIENVKNTSLWTAGLSLASLTWLIGARLLKQKLRGRIPILKFVPEIFILAVVSTGRLCSRMRGVRQMSHPSSFSHYRLLQARPERYRRLGQITGGIGDSLRCAFPTQAMEIRS